MYLFYLGVTGLICSFRRQDASPGRGSFAGDASREITGGDSHPCTPGNAEKGAAPGRSVSRFTKRNRHKQQHKKNNTV